MSDIFYTGSDIVIDFHAFEDSQMVVESSFLGYHIDVAFYTEARTRVAVASTRSGGGTDGMSVERVSSSQIRVVVPASVSVEFTPGALTVEISMTHEQTNRRSIAKESVIFIEDSVIGLR